MKHQSHENAVWIAIHPPTYRRGGFLAHGVLNFTTLLQQDCVSVICTK